MTEVKLFCCVLSSSVGSEEVALVREIHEVMLTDSGLCVSIKI